MKNRSVVTNHTPIFYGLLEMRLREQAHFRWAAVPRRAFPLGEPTGHFAAKRKVSEWVIYFSEVYDRPGSRRASCIYIPQYPPPDFGPICPEVMQPYRPPSTFLFPTVAIIRFVSLLYKSDSSSHTMVFF